MNGPEEQTDEKILFMGARGSGKSAAIRARYDELRSKGTKVLIVGNPDAAEIKVLAERCAEIMNSTLEEATERLEAVAREMAKPAKTYAEVMEEAMVKLSASMREEYPNFEMPQINEPPPKGHFRRQFGGVNDHHNRKNNKKGGRR